MGKQLTCTVEIDDAVRAVCASFDFPFDGVSRFDVPEITPPEDWGVGLIVGPSGSGKSSALASFGQEAEVEWHPGRAIVSHFASVEDAQERLSAVGLNSLPSWVRPYRVLSTGERFRADLARRIHTGAVIDEFTSVVDRVVARSASVALRRFVRARQLRRIVLASCHYDIVEWLEPDWVFDTATGRMTGRGCQRRPTIAIDVVPCNADEWRAFAPHHYLDHGLNRSARCWLAKWGPTTVGFVSALAFPNGAIQGAWREHRTVVFPDFQGLGIGPRISDAVADIFVAAGHRYFSKTAHPRLGGYREASPLWRGTSKNRRARLDYSAKFQTKEDGHKMRHAGRVCFSHEYIGGGHE
jgi:GNAT superfamily N-acetyltransferase